MFSPGDSWISSKSSPQRIYCHCTQADHRTRNNPDWRPDECHHQTWRVGERHRLRHGGFLRMISDVLLEKHHVSARHPDAVHKAENKPMKKGAIRAQSCNEESKNQKNEKPHTSNES